MPKDGALKKKIGPLSTGAWIGVGAASLGVLYVIRSRRAAAANAADAAAQGTTGGQIPPGDIASGLPSTTTPGSSTITDWQSNLWNAIVGDPQAKRLGISPEAAYNAVVRVVNGQCVGKNAAALVSKQLPSVGVPPGFTLPPIAICTNSAGQQITTQKAIAAGL